MKKVLVIAPYPYLPYFSGGQKFIARFLHYLGRETSLTVISVPGNEVSLADYPVLPILKRSFSRYFDLSLVKRITDEVKTNGYEAIIWEHPYYAWLAFRVRKRTGARTIIHTHNIESRRFRSTGRWWWPLLKGYEKWCFRKADHLFFITPDDLDFAVNNWQIPASKCSEIPFGIEIKQPPADRGVAQEKLRLMYGIMPDEKILLFNGLLDYQPNLDALNVILEKINPLLVANKSFRYKLIVCGKGLPESMDNLSNYRDKHIIYAGFVEDIDLYFRGADIFLNPVQSGGGIKTKMVEAIAAGTTVIATETGAAGIKKETCGNKLVVTKDNDWEGFTNAILANAGVTGNTPAAFYEYYHWENIIRKVLPHLS